MKLLTLMLAVNDEYGNPSGHIEGVSWEGPHGTIAELTAGIWPPSDCPKFSCGSDFVKISRRKFPIRGYKTWVGNWCWDAIAVTHPVAVDLLSYLRDDLKWRNEGGDCYFGDIWDSKAKIRLSDVASLSMTSSELAERKAARGAAR